MATDPAIVRAALRWRGDLERLDAQAARTLTAVYGDAWRSTRRELETLTARIARAVDAGEPMSPAWLYQQRRLDATLEVLADGLNRFADRATATVEASQLAAARQGAAMAADTAGLAVAENLGVAATFETPPTESLRALTGHLADGSPLADLFAAMPATASSALQAALASGIIQGISPRQMVDRARDALAGDLHRALTIARTETMRAHREAARQTWADTGVIRGWTWLCACDARSCAACWAMHGREFPIGEPMGTHPNCRCAQVPIAPTWEQLGTAPGTIPPPATMQAGSARFARLTPAERRTILGPGRADAYEAGDVALEDFVDIRSSAAWGDTRTAGTVGRARQRAAGLLDEPGRLGPGRLPQPGEVDIRRARRALERDRATARRVDIAARHGVTPADLAEARPMVDELRRAARQEAAQSADDLFHTIDQVWDARHVRRPSRAVTRRDARNRGIVDRSGIAAEYDWMEGLDATEARRIRRWMNDDSPVYPDLLPSHMEATEGVLSTDVAVARWVDATRRHDALRSLQSGRVPSYWDGSLNDLAPDTTADGLDLARLFGDDPDEAAGYVARWLADQRADDAYRTLRQVDYLEGPPPWRLDEFTYTDELADTEGRLREARDTGGRDRAAEQRWAELVPDGEAWDEHDRPIPAGELWARFRRLADLADIDAAGAA